MLSAVIITKNEQSFIEDCLLSLNFADEIIVVDTGNTDQTNVLAKNSGARIVKSTGRDFSQFRNAGLKQVTGDWVLYVDADERISPLLRQEIQQTILDKPSQNAFAIPRKNYFLGRHMVHGGWGDDYVIRLFKTRFHSGHKNPLHEQPQYTGELKKLSQPLIHISHRDLFSMTEKTLNFTGYEANLRLLSGHPPIVVWRLIRVMFTEFWLRFGKYSAWRDGTEGVIDGLFQVFNTFIIYTRLWELQRHANRRHN